MPPFVFEEYILCKSLQIYTNIHIMDRAKTLVGAHDLLKIKLYLI